MSLRAKLEDSHLPQNYDILGNNAPILTREGRMVQIMSSLGLSAKDIARVLGVTPLELNEKYNEEIATGSPLANISVALVAYQMATDGEHPEMTRFWLKCRAGWAEKNVVEHTGKDGNPIEIEVTAKQKLERLINPE